jgi:hypothetical protein
LQLSLEIHISDKTTVQWAPGQYHSKLQITEKLFNTLDNPSEHEEHAENDLKSSIFKWSRPDFDTVSALALMHGHTTTVSITVY